MKSTFIALVAALIFLVASASNLRPAVELLLRRDTLLRGVEINNATTPNLFSRILHHFDLRQEVGRCGPTGGGESCGSQCCSSFDYCGSDQEHCALLVGCQPQYGRCGNAAPEPTPTPTPLPSLTPTPSPSSSSTVITSSASVVSPSSSTVLPPLPTNTLIISPNGQCGNVTTCSGSSFGTCCSEFYFCGSDAQYCGTGCHSAFGICNGVVPPVSSSNPVPLSSSSSTSPVSSSTLAPVPSSSSTPTPTQTPTPKPTPSSSLTPSSTAPAMPTNVSTNGRCGAEGGGTTCQGSTIGRCCSDYGWCGSSDEYCRLSYGCRPDFGTCG